MGDDETVILPALALDDDAIVAFCRRHGMRRLAAFGSVLREEDFSAASDLDLLVEFLPDRTPGLLRLASMELELEGLLGREVELRTPEDLSRHFRDSVRAGAATLYDAA